MQQIHETEFIREILPSKAPVVLEFYSPTCSHCKMLTADIAGLEAEFPEVRFVRIDITEDPALAEHYDIRSVPVCLFLKNGALKDKTIGYQHPQIIRDEIRKIQG